MKIVLHKYNNVFHSIESEDIDSLKDGEYLANLTQPRNLRFHKKFFAMLKKVFENQDIYTDVESLRWELLLKAGYYKKHCTLKGKMLYFPDSISFENMDQIEFEDLYKKVIDVVFMYFIKGTDEDQLRMLNELNSF